MSAPSKHLGAAEALAAVAHSFVPSAIPPRFWGIDQLVATLGDAMAGEGSAYWLAKFDFYLAIFSRTALFAIR